MPYLRLLLTAVFALQVASAAKPDRWRDLTSAQLDQISKAVDQINPQVKPGKTKRVLLCTYAQGFWHNSIPWGAKALELMGSKTGAYELVVAEDQSAFTPENLATFDAIAVNNVTGIDRFISDPDKRTAFIDFVRNGGGLFANHSASDGGWPEYSDLLGGRFDGHPWGAGGLWGFQVEEPDHALCAAFHKPQFQLKDEIYQLKDHFSRDTHRVLVSLDLSDPATDAVKGRRSDRDYAVSMIRPFGKGRVFYSSFGHREDVHTNPMMLQHYFDGLQYALGELKVDDRPVDLFTRLQRFHFGRNYEVEFAYRGKITKAAPEQRAQLEAQLLKTLQGDANYDAKHLALDLLPLVWSANSATVLPGLFTDPKHSQRALENYRLAIKVFKLDRAAALKTMRDALQPAGDVARIAILNALALERDAEAASVAANLSRSTNPAVVDAAIMALSRFGEEGLNNLLKMPVKKVNAGKRYDAILTAAEALADNARAAEVYRQFTGDSHPQHVRIAALRGLAHRDAKAAAPELAAAIANGPDDMRQAAFVIAAGLTDATGTDLLLAAPAELDATTTATLVTALAGRADARCRQRLRQLAISGPQLAAELAIAALAEIGKRDDVDALVAALSRDELAAHAVEALTRIAIPETEAVLVATTAKANAKTLVALCEIFRERRATAAADLLMQLRTHADAKVAREAWRALAACATAKQLPTLLGELRNLAARDANRMQKVLVAIGETRADNDATVADLATAADTANPDGYRVIIDTLPAFQTAAALGLLRQALTKEEFRRDAVKALGNWRSAAPIKDLLATAAAHPGRPSRLLALAGVAEILTTIQATAKPTAKPTAIDAHYAKTFAIAKDPQALVPLLTALANHPTPASLELAAGYLQHPDDNVFAKAWQTANALQGANNFVLKASHGGNDLDHLVDGNPATRWTTGTPMRPDMWFSVSLGKLTHLKRIILDNTNPQNASHHDYPREPKLEVSDDGVNWRPVDAKITTGIVTTFVCDVTAAHFKITNGAPTKGNYWSVHELRLNDAANVVAKPQPIPADHLTVAASARPQQAAKAIDGNDRTFWETGASLTGNEWFELAFPAPKKLARIVVNSQHRADKQTRGFAVSLSPDGTRWTPPMLARDGAPVIDVSLYPGPVKKVRIHQTSRDQRHQWAIGEVTLFANP